MRIQTVKLLSGQVRKSLLKNRSTFWLLGVFNLFLLFALFTGSSTLQKQQETAAQYSKEVRELWLNNPDKHPHRMAHYGYVAFRQRFPLSFFDFGMDSYLGNVIFLEAHRQNTVNFSEASLSNGLLRFGEISAALILLVLLPLLIFFWGFDLISREREHGTLRILLTQGISWAELIAGKALGLFSLSMLIFLPAVAVTIVLLLTGTSFESQVYLRVLVVVLAYSMYYLLLSLMAVYVSAVSKSSKASLMQLMSLWLIFTLILPKIAQVTGQKLFPSPSKIEFDTEVEQELVKLGDSHNPDDPHYKALKDSLLTAYGVTETTDLPVNYSGIVMKEGEKLSAQAWQMQHDDLVNTYQKQQKVIRLTGVINPYLAVKNLSMALAGTDYQAYNDFQRQTEDFRYNLAQTMNQLQIDNISNKVKTSADKSAVLSHDHWEVLPDFKQTFPGFGQTLSNEWFSAISLLAWLVALILLIRFSSHRLKAI